MPTIEHLCSSDLPLLVPVAVNVLTLGLYHCGRNACSFAGRRMISAKHCKDAPSVLFGAMRVARRLIEHVATKHGDGAHVVHILRENLAVSVWCVLANFLISISNSTGLWERRWAEPIQREVEGMRLCSPSLDILSWDARPGKLRFLFGFRPPIAAKPSDLSLLCELKGTPLAKVFVASDSDQATVTIAEGTCSPLELSDLDTRFETGLMKLCFSVPKCSPASIPERTHYYCSEGLGSASLDAEEEEVEDDGQGVGPEEELARERRAACIVCRFCRLCLIRWALRRAVKEARRLGLTAAGDGGQADGQASDVDAIDPFRRRLRYSVFEERAVRVGDQLRFGLWNMDWQSLLLDDSDPVYQQVLRGLRRFSTVYASRISNILIRSDLAFLELSRLTDTVNDPAMSSEASSTLAVLAADVNALEAALLVVDRQLLWAFAADLFESGQHPPADLDFLTPGYRLDSQHIPHAIQLIGILLHLQTSPQHQPPLWSWAEAANLGAMYEWPETAGSASSTSIPSVNNLSAVTFSTATFMPLSSAQPALSCHAAAASAGGEVLNSFASLGEGFLGFRSGVGNCAIGNDLPNGREEGGEMQANLAWGLGIGSEGDCGMGWMDAAAEDGGGELGWREVSGSAKKNVAKRRFGKGVRASPIQSAEAHKHKLSYGKEGEDSVET